MKTALQLQVASTFASTPIAWSLKRVMAEAGLDNSLTFVQFTQMSEYMLALAPTLATIAGSIVLLRLEDWLREDLKATCYETARDAWIRNQLRLRVEEFVTQFSILSRLGMQVWFLACPSNGWISEQHKLRSLCRTYTNLVVARVQSLPKVIVLNWPVSVPADDIVDRESDRLQHIPFTEGAFRQLGEWSGQQLARSLARNDGNSAAETGGSPELAAYLTGLHVCVRVVPASPAERSHIDRILRTVASFSLTGEKSAISEPEIDAMLEAEGCLLISVSDRISDYGPSGLIVFRTSGESLVIDSLALSCTVLGKQVEYAILSALGRIAAERHCAIIEFGYVQGSRNQPMLAFLQQVAECGPAGRYVLSTQDVNARIGKLVVNPEAWTLTD